MKWRGGGGEVENGVVVRWCCEVSFQEYTEGCSQVVSLQQHLQPRIFRNN